jgi:hypothetical protein
MRADCSVLARDVRRSVATKDASLGAQWPASGDCTLLKTSTGYVTVCIDGGSHVVPYRRGGNDHRFPARPMQKFCSVPVASSLGGCRLPHPMQKFSSVQRG